MKEKTRNSSVWMLLLMVMMMMRSRRRKRSRRSRRRRRRRRREQPLRRNWFSHWSSGIKNFWDQRENQFRHFVVIESSLVWICFLLLLSMNLSFRFLSSSASGTSFAWQVSHPDFCWRLYEVIDISELEIAFKATASGRISYPDGIDLKIMKI